MQIRCWKCGSKNVTVSVINQQSYSVGKGVAGTLLFGPGGAAMGVNGKSEEKTKYVCQACGEISTCGMDESMCQRIEEAIAEENTLILASLKESYPNIEWESTKKAPTGNYEGEDKIKIDSDIINDAIFFFDKPVCTGELIRLVARDMHIDTQRMDTGNFTKKVKDIAKKDNLVTFVHNKMQYYTRSEGCLKYVEYLIDCIKKGEHTNDKDFELIFKACATIEQSECCSEDMKSKIADGCNRLKEICRCKTDSLPIDSPKQTIEALLQAAKRLGYNDLAKQLTTIFSMLEEVEINSEALDNIIKLSKEYFDCKPKDSEMADLILMDLDDLASKIMLNHFEAPNKTSKQAVPAKQSSGGCYVATCVYGSYDCPEVWTLRRFRDDTLGSTWYGRLFIHLYYAISPTLVKWFGNTNWFKNLWRGTLNRMVANLQAKGVEDTPYEDKHW